MSGASGVLLIDDLVTELEALGLTSGDIVMVHASLRAIGPVDGGAAGIVDGLHRVVGPRGTLLMVLGALEDDDPFDHLATPSDPDVGALAEAFRLLPGTVVNNHPDGRFGARGRLAEQLLTDTPWDDYYGPGSPLHRFVDAGGKVLRLGADLDTVTLLHYAEYLAPIPDKRRVRRQHLVVAGDGAELREVDSLDDSNGIVEHPGEDYFAVILRSYLTTGRATTGHVGQAPSEVLDAADLVAFGVEWMTEHLTGGGGGAT
jgi:aminoglycoside N3'-acetyltransferase